MNSTILSEKNNKNKKKNRSNIMICKGKMTKASKASKAFVCILLLPIQTSNRKLLIFYCQSSLHLFKTLES